MTDWLDPEQVLDALGYIDSRDVMEQFVRARAKSKTCWDYVRKEGEPWVSIKARRCQCQDCGETMVARLIVEALDG